MHDLSRLRFLCRRGMKELDLLLERYLTQRYATATEDERAAFRRLLELPDPELFACLIGRERPADEGLAHVAEIIRSTR